MYIDGTVIHVVPTAWHFIMTIRPDATPILPFDLRVKRIPFDAEVKVGDPITVDFEMGA